MRNFLHTLKNLTLTPWRIICINAGVRLAVEGSEYLPVMKDIENSGAEILSCGTCLDYFKIKDKVRVGRISNMNEIVSSLLDAAKVITP